jgi:hypothetical protein
MTPASKLCSAILIVGFGVGPALAQIKTPPVPQNRISSSPFPASLTDPLGELQSMMAQERSTHELPDGKGAYNIGMSQVRADPQTCTLSWVESIVFKGNARNETSVRIALREVERAKADQAQERFVTPSIWMTNIFMLQGYQAGSDFLSRDSEGNQLGASQHKDFPLQVVSSGSEAESVRLESALSKAVSACKDTAPALLLNSAATPTGPSVEDSVSFINAQLASQSFHFVAHRSGDQQGDIDAEVGGQSLALVGSCITEFKSGASDKGRITPLEDVDPRSVSVEDYATWEHEVTIKDKSHPRNISFIFDPPVYLVLDSKGLESGLWLRFSSRSIAERVAKAYIHAVVLCGGGKNQPF